MSFANTCVVHDRADVAVDVVRVAEVEVAHGLAVALLRAGDGAGDDAVAVERVVQRRLAPEARLGGALAQLVGG
jgi:hypothetical protein